MKQSIPSQIYTDIKYVIDNQLIKGNCFKSESNNSTFEQLEFFGDSYLGYRISKIAIQKTTFDPCFLTEFRSAATNNETLGEFYDMLRLDSLPDVEIITTKKFKADTVEALIGELHFNKSNPKVKKLLDDIISHLNLLGEFKFNRDPRHQNILFGTSNTSIINHTTKKELSTSPKQKVPQPLPPVKPKVQVSVQPQPQLHLQPQQPIQIKKQTQKPPVQTTQPIIILQRGNSHPQQNVEHVNLQTKLQSQQKQYSNELPITLIDINSSKPFENNKEVLLSPFSINTLEDNFF